MKYTPFMLILRSISFFLFITLFIPNISAQLKNAEKEYFELFDQLTNSKNNNLGNGIEYSEKYLTKKGNHKYYKTKDFWIGTIVYDNQLYYNVLLQYDIHEDELIIKLYKGDVFRKIQLVKTKVKEFSIDKKQFVRISEESLDFSMQKKGNFYEVIFANEKLSSYKKRSKSRKVELDQGTTVYHSFKENVTYYLKYKNNLIKVKNKRSLIQVFPEQKKLINAFYSKNRILARTNFDQFLKELSIQLSKATI